LSEAEDQWTPSINLGMPVLIPEAYIADLNVRLGLYRRISELVDRPEIDSFAAELIDRFGPLPDEVENLLNVMTIKQLCRAAGVERVDAGPKGAVLSFHNNTFARPDKLVVFIGSQVGTMKLRPDHKLVHTRTWDDTATRVKGVNRLMQDLAKLVA
jgi:transcription-repair coupling factor (superfamily II helicase)